MDSIDNETNADKTESMNNTQQLPYINQRTSSSINQNVLDQITNKKNQLNSDFKDFIQNKSDALKNLS